MCSCGYQGNSGKTCEESEPIKRTHIHTWKLCVIDQGPHAGPCPQGQLLRSLCAGTMDVLMSCPWPSRAVSSIIPGGSVSSDPTLGCSTEAELSLSHWQTCEEDPDLSPPADTVTDADARHWLQLRPTDASNLTGKRVLETRQRHSQGFPGVRMLGHSSAQ